MRKLMLINPEQAFEMLDEYAGLYGDNGGDPDGNTWLPSDQDDIPDELAEQVIKAGYGQMVDVMMGTDEGIVNFLAQKDANAVLGLHAKLASHEFDEEDRERLKDIASLYLDWAHYGAYGAGDSHWVFVKEC